MTTDGVGMATPISSISAREYSWVDQPSDREDFRETVVKGDNDGVGGPCRDPTTLLGAVIWGDATAVSNACRCARPGTADDFICDDRKLGAAEKACWAVAKKAAWKAIELFFGARLAKP
jgi:hypothetical protein